MLIRLVNHHINNPHQRDKLINIENFPESYFVQVQEGHKVLKTPWEVDNPANLSRDVKDRFYKTIELFEVVSAYREPHTSEEFYHKSKYLPHKVGAIKLDYGIGPGEEAWKLIERLLEKVTPRDVPVPRPAIVGDQMTWKLEADDVPNVVLPVEEAEIVQPEKVEKKKIEKVYTPADCPECGRTFKHGGALNLHKIRAHKKEVAEALNG